MTFTPQEQEWAVRVFNSNLDYIKQFDEAAAAGVDTDAVRLLFMRLIRAYEAQTDNERNRQVAIDSVVC
jgi:hypothetical protein